MRLQSLFKLTLGLTVIAMVLTACGGDAPTDEPTAESQTADDQPTAEFLATDAPTLEPTITPSPNLPPPTPVPLDVQLGDLPAGEYTLSMVGALNSDIGFTPFDTGLTGADYDIAAGGTNLNGPYTFALWTDILTDGTTEDTTARIVFTLPASAEAGSYQVVGRDAMSNPDDIGVEVVTGFQSQRFAANATGTLDIVANGGAGGVFTGEFEVTVGDDAGNTILANGRASAIGFNGDETAELTLSGGINVSPPPENLGYTLSRLDTASNNDWQLEVAVPSDQSNPYVVLHRFYMTPNISIGTYDVQPRGPELDVRPEDVDVTVYVEIIDTTNGTRERATDITGTLEVVDIRNTFTATFTLNYVTPLWETTNEEGETITVGGEAVVAEGGVFYMFKPAG